MNRLLLFFACCIIAAQAANLPKTYKRCSRKDPKLNDCLSKAFLDALKQMRSGIKELGMPSLEPVELAQYTLDQDKGPVVLNITLTNAKTRGVTDIEVKSFEFDPKELTIKINCFFKTVKTEADYVISGRFLVLPITGKGKVNYQLDDSDAKILIEFTKKTVKGKEYLDVKTFELTQEKIGHAKFNFENLFNGDKQLGDALNESMNENWEEMVKALGPSFSRVWSEYFKGYSQNIFKNVPYNEIILDK